MQIDVNMKLQIMHVIRLYQQCHSIYCLHVKKDLCSAYSDIKRHLTSSAKFNSVVWRKQQKHNK